MGIDDREYMKWDYPWNQTTSGRRRSRQHDLSEAPQTAERRNTRKGRRAISNLLLLAVFLSAVAVGVRWIPKPPAWLKAVIQQEDKAAEFLAHSLRAAADWVAPEKPELAGREGQTKVAPRQR
jgi:hypothetical protein